MNQLVTRSTVPLAPQLDYIVVDGSYSMQDKWDDTIAALNGFMDTLKASNIHSHGIVSVFDSGSLDSVQRDSVIADWPLFNRGNLRTSWGNTPLYDAINLMGRRVRDLNPQKASIVICTDGEEMGSRHTDVHQARAILNWLKAKGYQVTFLGCDFNNSRQAAALGANERNMIGVAKARLGEAGKLLGSKRVRNIHNPDEDINFSDDEKQTFGGYLMGPGR